jgi:hypothetical protein
VKVRPYLIMFCLLAAICTIAYAQMPKTVGQDACAKCHASERRTIAVLRMTMPNPVKACNGAGEKHLKSNGDAGTMFSYLRATADEVRARCGQCHQNAVMAKHAEGDVACTSCHSSHHYVQKKYLLKPEDTEGKPS